MRSNTSGSHITFLAVAVALLLASNTMQAFHSGGIAECGGCHSMHAPKTSGSVLLRGSDPSSTCLTCHEDSAFGSYHIATPSSAMPTGTAPLQRTPGGDFGWLKKGYGFTTGGVGEPGEAHGHNIVAADNGYIADPTNTTAPGGTFSGSQLACTSCHDPHSSIRRNSSGAYVKPGAGQAADPIVASGSYDNSVAPAAGQAVGAYRLLRGLGDNSQGVTFSGVAIAVAPSTYNQSEASKQVRVAYGTDGANTWGNWCATCHPNMQASTSRMHPADRALGDNTAIYDSYKRSGDLSGVNASSFSSLVPFMEATGNIAVLQSHAKNNDTYLTGPSRSDQVSCLSCHRAHASGFPKMLRFGIANEFMVFGGVYNPSSEPDIARGKTETEVSAAYYDRPASVFATYQRSLCHKCHAKD